MPRAISEARVKVTVLAEEPELPADGTGTISATLLNGGQDAQCNVARNGTRMSATASDTISDPALCDEGNRNVLGASNYEWTWNVFRYYDEDGAVDPSEDWLFDLVREKGQTVIAARRQNGRLHDADWQPGEHGHLYVGVNDNPQEPTDMGGYQKQTVPFSDIKRVPFTVGE